MLKLKGNFLKNLNKIILPKFPFYSESDQDKFGIGGKYVELDKENKKEIKLKKVLDDSEQFGTLTNDHKSISFKTKISFSKPLSDSIEYDLADEENEKKFEKVLSHIRLSNDPNERPNTDNYYASRMKKFAEEGKITDAISVFYDEMIERDRFKPTLWLYKTFIKILARAEYTHMAFAAFKKLTDSGEDDWTSGFKSSYLKKIITLLFLSCSNCKWKAYGIQKTSSIRIYLKNRQITPNAYMYSAMILSYGKCGAIYEAFNAVDEMLLNKIEPNLDIFSNLLCACISDKKLGFKYAMNVWQLCLKSNLKPNLTMYNLLLKATKDCNYGIMDSNSNSIIQPKKQINKVADKILIENKDEKNLLINEDILQVKTDQVHVIEDLQVIGKSINKQVDNLEWWQDIKKNINKKELLNEMSKHKPELKELSKLSQFKSVLTHSNFSKNVNELIKADLPTQRFEALGGLSDFMNALKHHQVDPDFKLFNTILQLLPNNLEYEENLIKIMYSYNSRPDLDFINILIKRRLFRKDYIMGDKAFELIQEFQLIPNIHTFGVMAYKVNNTKNLQSYLNDLKTAGFELNPIIITTLINKGFLNHNHLFLIHLCEYIKANKIRINDTNISRIEFLLNYFKEKIINLEKNKHITESDLEYLEKLRIFFRAFSQYYFNWIKVVHKEEKIHPYKKFERENDKLYNSFLRRTENLE